jgi:glycosyltransferase involved in cell wall biosynthesis
VNICDDVAELDAGIVVPRDPARLANAIIALLDDPQRRARLGANGRRLVRERYAPNVVGPAMRRAYEAAIARGDN